MKIKDFKERLLTDTYYLPVSIYQCPAFWNADIADKSQYIKDEIVLFLEDYSINDEDDTASDDFTEKLDEWCQNEVSVYNIDRLKWLANNLGNAETVNEAIKEFGFDSTDFDLFNVLGYAMVRANYEAMTEIIGDIEYSK